MTGPAIENICAAVPSTKPSCFHSSAGDTTLFAKPVIGTIVPAPACLAILSKTPIPVKIAVIIIIHLTFLIISCNIIIYYL